MHHSSMAYTKWKTQERNGQNIDDMEALQSRGKGTWREALLVEDKIEWYWRKPTLAEEGGGGGGEAHIP